MTEIDTPTSKKDRRQNHPRNRQAEKQAQRGPTLSFGRLATIGGVIFFGAVMIINSIRGDGSPESLNDRLEKYNSNFREQPTRLISTAEAIANEAADVFCRHLECNAQDFKGQITFQSHRDYLQTSAQNSPCTEDDNTDFVAYTDHVNSIYADLDVLLYTDPSKKAFRAEVAQGIFEMAVHELHHKKSKRVEYEGPMVNSLTLTANKGLISLFEDTAKSKPGRVCELKIRGAYDEAVVQDNTLRILEAERVPAPLGSYSSLVDTFRRMILPLFDDSDEKPLEYQQNSDPQGLMLAVGRKLGYTSYIEALGKGEDFLFNTLDPVY